MSSTSTEGTTVTGKGQVTIPKSIRRRFGIRKGSRVVFTVVDDCVDLRLVNPRLEHPQSGFGMLKSSRKSVPVNLDPAALVDEESQ